MLVLQVDQLVQDLQDFQVDPLFLVHHLFLVGHRYQRFQNLHDPLESHEVLQDLVHLLGLQEVQSQLMLTILMTRTDRLTKLLWPC